MRILLQRVAQAEVIINNQSFSKINQGLLLLVGISNNDTAMHLNKLAEKVINLRIFEDEQGKLNLSILDINAAIMVVSQFTLYADTRKGRRPGFSAAAQPEQAAPLIETFIAKLRALGINQVACGQFGANMQVSLINDGPITIMLDSDDYTY